MVKKHINYDKFRVNLYKELAEILYKHYEDDRKVDIVDLFEKDEQINIITGIMQEEYDFGNNIERAIEDVVNILRKYALEEEKNEIVGVRSKKVVGSYDLYDKYGNKVKFNYELKKFYNVDDIELINDKTEEQLMEGAGVNPGMIKNLVKTGTKFVKKGAKYAKKGVKYVTAHKDQIKKGYKTAKKYGKKGMEFVDKHKGEIKEAGKAVHDVYREFRPKQPQVQQPQRVVQQPVKTEPVNVGPVNDFDVPI